MCYHLILNDTQVLTFSFIGKLYIILYNIILYRIFVEYVHTIAHTHMYTHTHTRHTVCRLSLICYRKHKQVKHTLYIIYYPHMYIYGDEYTTFITDLPETIYLLYF